MIRDDRITVTDTEQAKSRRSFDTLNLGNGQSFVAGFVVCCSHHLKATIQDLDTCWEFRGKKQLHYACLPLSYRGR